MDKPDGDKFFSLHRHSSIRCFLELANLIRTQAAPHPFLFLPASNAE